jgi:uncharacterized protein YrrD
LAESLQYNRSLKVLVIADNMVGQEVMTMLAGRMKGNIHDVCFSVKVQELVMPMRYAEGRYDRKKLLKLKAEIAERKKHKTIVSSCKK